MTVSILIGDCRERLRDIPRGSIQTCITSPPYFGLRNYGHADQIGLEPSPGEFVEAMVSVFHQVGECLTDDGTLWLNLGDSYAGSGKGGHTEGSKQSRGQPGKNQKENAVTNITRDNWRPGSGRADGLVDERSQRNRNGIGPVEGIKPKDLIGIPWMVAFALRHDGWYLRSEIVWNKPNCMPESVTDRPTCAHEKLFLFSKSLSYFYDAEAIKESAIYAGLVGQGASGFKDAKKFSGKHSDKQRGHVRRHAGFNERWDAMSKAEQCSGTRNKRNVWMVPVSGYSEAHFATYPPDLIEPCVLAGSRVGDMVLDPFGGAGTTGLVADRHGRNAMLIELNPEYAEMAKRRLERDAGMFSEVACG